MRHPLLIMEASMDEAHEFPPGATISTSRGNVCILKGNANRRERITGGGGWGGGGGTEGHWKSSD
jgi:hypothetical protein